ncbi:MAG: 5-formyltetrahydrofolate cyclo-ligase [Clostridia bacterium]|nr:5-formyltetrahydrofolate cyclo-ligase [Clostridia bacterium]
MPITDIRPVKSALREKYKAMRLSLDSDVKQNWDEAVTRRVLSLWQYRSCEWLLIYVSTPIEVDTHALVRQALADGKKVAVPRCVPQTRDMEFYRITSLEELVPGTFGVLEPEPSAQNLVQAPAHALCVVPAFCYDREGFRLGYGKGYYDRFLFRYEGQLIGLCYDNCMTGRLPHGRYDRCVSLVVTERRLYKIPQKRGEPYDR